jgi:hypothetical protein
VSPPEHPAHLIPAFLHACLLYFLNLPSLPVRFLGWAHAGHIHRLYPSLESSITGFHIQGNLFCPQVAVESWLGSWSF